MGTSTPNGIVIAHDDHDLQSEHLTYIDTVLSDWDGSFIIKCLKLPDELPSIPSALYGPEAGDDPITNDQVFYLVRNNRRGPSRLINAPMRPARNLVVIGMQVEDGTMLLFTAYGTQASMASPKEWWDYPPPDLTGMCPRELSVWCQRTSESADFWSLHALATGGE
tara:strand:- start:16541 stop:17038 length:498 start_codon:yes stop_codon:yes gene_type:complete